MKEPKYRIGDIVIVQLENNDLGDSFKYSRQFKIIDAVYNKNENWIYLFEQYISYYIEEDKIIKKI